MILTNRTSNINYIERQADIFISKKYLILWMIYKLQDTTNMQRTSTKHTISMLHNLLHLYVTKWWPKTLCRKSSVPNKILQVYESVSNCPLISKQLYVQISEEILRQHRPESSWQETFASCCRGTSDRRYQCPVDCRRPATSSHTAEMSNDTALHSTRDYQQSKQNNLHRFLCISPLSLKRSVPKVI